MICEFDYINYFVVLCQCQVYVVVQIMFLFGIVYLVNSYGVILLKGQFLLFIVFNGFL